MCFGEIKSFFGLPDSKAGAKMRTARSNKRLHDSKRKADIETKKRRTKSRQINAKRQAELEIDEGISYGAGIAD